MQFGVLQQCWYYVKVYVPVDYLLSSKFLGIVFISTAENKLLL